MSQVIALKYRPSKFSEVKGQDHTVSIIKSSILSGNVPTSIILSGIRGTGKTTLARLIAKLLNCDNPIDMDVCGLCKNCIDIDKNCHIDVIEMDAASNTGVDNMRNVIESSQYSAVMGKHKVFIIDEAHMLSKSAFNALLKNLEDPSENVKFIFATTEIKKIPDTILSRCMRLNLENFTNDMIVSTLKYILDNESKETGYKYLYEDDALYEIANASYGSLRDAETILNQAILLSNSNEYGNNISIGLIHDMLGSCQRGIFFDIIEAMVSGNISKILSETRDLIKSGVDPTFMLQTIMDIIHFIICIKQAPDITSDNFYLEIDRTRGGMLASQLDMQTLLIIWQVLMKGYQEYIQSPLKYQTLEMTLIKVCFIPDKKIKFESFDELMNFIKQSKEPILYSKIKDNLVVKEYLPGKIKCTTNDKQLIHEISDKLKSITNMNWEITISDISN